MADGLNPAQQAAVETLSGPLLVLAGAGTGKTRVVTQRIANLIRHGTPGPRILGVTFTNKAAAEMLDRVRAQIGKVSRKERPLLCTFHSLCVKILRRHIDRLGYPKTFAIYDRGDQESLARDVLREIRVSTSLLRPADLLAAIGRWKSSGVAPEAAGRQAIDDKEHLAAMAYRRYQKQLYQRGAVDFDDLLIHTNTLFQGHPSALGQVAAQFDHILVDEYQDTNGAQYRIVKALAAPHRNLCVVGDDDQSIYAWRGAEVTHILNFRRDWPEAKIVRLETNYRSTGEILDLANRLIAYNRKRYDKVLRAARRGGEPPQIRQYQDEEAEAKEVVADIQRRLGRPGVSPADFAILFRTNEQPRPFETAFRKANIRYILIGGKSFYDRREVKDVLAYLKTLHAPRDETALRRIINQPPRGIGGKTIETLLERAVSQGKSLWETLQDPAARESLSLAAADAVSNFVELIREFQAKARRQSLTQTIAQLLDRIGYEDEIRRVCPDPDEQQSRISALEQVVTAAANFEREEESPKLADFLDELTLSGRELSDDKQRQLEREGVILMTLHSAKGLEFPYVYLVGLEEGILPHARSVAVDGEAIDEERRLCYVGLTRAQEGLTLSMSLSRTKWGKPRGTIPSRFLFEITGQADA